MVSLSLFASSQSGEYPRKRLLIAWKGITSPRMVIQVPKSRKMQVFRSKQVKDLYFRCGVNHITTTPYYPQVSLAERVNRNLKSALSSSIPKYVG